MNDRQFVPARLLLLATAGALLAACGGGGGGGSPPPPPPAPAPAGSFTMSASSVSFSAPRQKAAPAAQTVRVTLADSSAAALGAAYVAPQTQPAWLDVAITGAPPTYDLVLTITRTDLPVGTSSAVLTIGTANASGAVLRTQQLTVNYAVLAPLVAATAGIDTSFVFGHSTASSVTNVVVATDALTQWRATSNQPWVTVPAGNRTGGGLLPITVDSTTLAAGTASATVTLVNTADPSDVDTVAVNSTITDPALVVSSSPVVLGNADGLEFSAGEDLAVSLATGTNTYPLSLSVTTQNGVEWLSAHQAAADVGANPTLVQLNADRSRVVPGSHAGSLRLQTTIRGRVLTRDVPVTLNKEGHWLHVSGLGAAFSKFPTRSVLRRSFEVRSSQGRSDVPWTAASSQPWLQVTTHGMSGSDLELTAVPGSLANGQYYATVTIGSPNADILNTQVMRVGLRIGGTDPGETSLPLSPVNVVANPVEPYVYANSQGTDIGVYDVYSGAVVHTFTNAAQQAGHMTVSHDGRTLFVNDESANLVRALDGESGAPLRTYPWPQGSGSNGMAYMRPNGQPLLVLGAGSFFDADTATLHATRHEAGWYGGWLAMTGDASDTYLFTQTEGLSPSTITQFALGYSALPADRITLQSYNGTSAGENGQAICVSADGATLYSANGYPYWFTRMPVTTLNTATHLGASPYPNNAACGWNGLFFGGADAYYDPVDVWVFAADGTPHATIKLHPGGNNSLFEDSLVLSGDNTRLIGSTGAPSFDFRIAPPP
jgi:hypothetical protein